MVVVNDLGGMDPDDKQSLVHLLVCSDMVDIEGIITGMAWVGEPDRNGYGHINAILDEYAKVLPNLQNHSNDYPSIEYLRSITKAGTSVVFNSANSSDPDNDELKWEWSVYPEASTYKGQIFLEGGDTEKCKISIPEDATGKSIHIILKVTDNGIPELTSYRRVVIEVS